MTPKEKIKLLTLIQMTLILIGISILVTFFMLAWTTVNATTINESMVIVINNSTDWRTNLSTCCDWMG